MRYKARFTGRKVNASGVFYPITAYINGNDTEAARLALYDEYEHISRLKLETASIYDECVSLGIPTNNHESDLYIPVTTQTRQLLKNYGLNAGGFTNQVEGGVWFDIPFQFKPFWDKVSAISAPKRPRTHLDDCGGERCGTP